MSVFLYIFALISFVVALECASSECSEVYGGSGVNNIQIDGRKQEPGFFAGKTLCIRGGFYPSGMWVYKVTGTLENPVTITNCDGQAMVNSTSRISWEMVGVEHVRVLGTGSSAHRYGFVVGMAVAGNTHLRVVGGSSFVEIGFVEIDGGNSGYAGIQVASYPQCGANPGDPPLFTPESQFVQRNTFIHDCYVHDVVGEGLYIGPSHWGLVDRPKNSYQPGFTLTCNGQQVVAAEADLVDTVIERVVTERTGRDGIQIAATVAGARVTDCVIRDYALQNDWGHTAGLMVNPGTTGLFERIIIEQSAFATALNLDDQGVALQGMGDSDFRNIMIINANAGLMFLRNTATSGTMEQEQRLRDIRLAHVTVVNATREAVYFFCNNYNDASISIVDSVLHFRPDSPTGQTDGYNGNLKSCLVEPWLQADGGSVVVLGDLAGIDVPRRCLIPNQHSLPTSSAATVEPDVLGRVRGNPSYVGAVALCSNTDTAAPSGSSVTNNNNNNNNNLQPSSSPSSSSLFTPTPKLISETSLFVAVGIGAGLVLLCSIIFFFIGRKSVNQNATSMTQLSSAVPSNNRMSTRSSRSHSKSGGGGRSRSHSGGRAGGALKMNLH